MRRNVGVHLAAMLYCLALTGAAWSQSAGGLAGATSSVNYAPVAFPQLVQLNDFNGITVTVNASDADGDPLTYTLASGPSLGSLGTLDPVTGQVIYTPPAGFSTTDSFTFFANDGVLSSEAVAVTILAPLGTSTISPSSLSFGNQGLNNTSGAKKVTVKNAGTNPLTITNLALSGTDATDFSYTSASLPITLAANKSTTVQVMFTPIATGTRTGAVVITSNASASPQSVALTGVGMAQVTLSPAALTFGNQGLLNPSAVKVLTLTNNNSTPLASISLSLPPDFAETDTCSTSIPAKGKCAINVTFTPSVLGSRNGTFTINDSASNSPQLVSLTGTGVLQVTLSASTLTFAKQKVGTSSAAKSVTLTNNNSIALTMGTIQQAGDYSSTTTCGTSVAAKGKCTISITFTPTTTGTRTGSTTVNNSASNSPQTIALTGTGD